MRAVAARWWATAHRARSEEQELERVGMPGPSNRQVKQEKPRRWPTLGSTLSSVSRRTPTPSASNWPRYLPRKLVGGGGEAASPSDRRKQCMQLWSLRPELVARADACAVLRTWFSRRGRPRGETSHEHSRQGPQGVPRDHTAFSCSLAPCSPLGARCTRHTVSPETLPCPSIVKCDLVCNCHLRTAVHL